MAIRYHIENIPKPRLKRRKLSRWIGETAALYGKRVGEITYIFCDEEEILRINKTYLNHNYYTDIITFDYTEGEIISGDLFICPDTIRSNAEQYQTPFDEELHRVIIHGILHLCGFGDKSPEEEQVMRKMENQALEIFYSSETERDNH